jgi:hypothetical protein
MVLIEELRSIAKSVEFHLGAGASAEGRAADEIEWLRRRLAALERVICENLDPSRCAQGPDRRLVEEIVRRRSHAPSPARPVDPDGKSSYSHAPTNSVVQRATTGAPQPECEPVDKSSRECEPSSTREPPPEWAAADFEIESAGGNLVAMAQNVQAALLRSARPNE